MDFIINKYPNSCFVSDLLCCYVDILLNEIYIECKELFSKVSQFIVSKYNMIENNLDLVNKKISIFLHYSLLFCSL